jgi:hypothetical protein
MTLSGSYPTPEAFASGLFFPSFPRCLRPGCGEGHADGSLPLEADPLWEGPDESTTLTGATPHSACEFEDFCNRVYGADLLCDCEKAWKRRAGLVLPTLT